MRLIFRADGNSTIGLGHVVRSLALADMVRAVAPCWFAIQNPSAAIRELLHQAQVTLLELPTQPTAEEAAYLAAQVQPDDVLVLDGYAFDTAYQATLRHRGCRLVVIDDLRAWPSEADLIINHSPGVTPAMYQARPHARFCLGPEYSLLRAPFLTSFRLPAPPAPIAKVLLCFGGADPQQLTRRFLAALLPLESVREVGVITGSAFPYTPQLQELAAQHPAKRVAFYQNAAAPEMVALLQGHDAVVCPASTILIESLFLGKAVVTGYYVENQRHLAAYVQEHEQAFSLGDLNTIAADDLQATLAQVLQRAAHQPRQPYVLAPGPERLQAEFRRLLPAGPEIVP
ncbi:UDP-2,4-diacetamido-2,4,6-trideoxy-beta-L-altropyranose hydrolase [Hymenobacter chitinivorans]|uniref:UDP-2,4-diacetamido-2,4, 6-trideoxy-beta-L-altropyranose hydrolase n=1 Tax=Hymenobacter chitinivorans DSM 11115 TaxID=1121954 RepID=A0A2M9BP87_9BACT|nr:UDP-2,4-diacetamido-2,4,6-trideoxy-beta-L-altropyranose hydrolase [Hymenobacter chitinivorans]PJJ59732.1 UDP-2,4-diacetamido-2,4,6-trideoxy-beta-L-altropyranose hydrolase [Hymenobacter chitinivorans DSM 11115]